MKFFPGLLCGALVCVVLLCSADTKRESFFARRWRSLFPGQSTNQPCRSTNADSSDQ